MTSSIVFIDSCVADYQSLIGALPADTEWFLLNAEEDGVVQMARILANYSALDSIQVISHGSTGTLYLGSTVLDSSNLDSYQTQLQAIGSNLTATGDILLYGCNVGAGETGQQFITALAELTGADVAASDDATGLNGDWILETSSGTVEATGLSSATYTSTLDANDHATEGDDTLIGEGGNDTIHGLGGDDFIDGEAGPDLLYGDAGNDTIDGNFGNDTIYGGLGNDTLLDAQGSNYLDGEEGDDSLTAWSLTGNHTLVGGLGNDTIDGTGLSLNLQSGDGVHYICAHGNLVVSGTTSYVQHGAATISGGAGDDGYYTQWDGSGYYSNNLSAIYLTDVLIQGDEGRDGLSVEFAKNARLEGGVGADILSAYANGWHLGYFMGESSYDINYQLDGGADDDRLTVTSSAHRHYGRIDLSLEGGTGNDTLTASTESPADANYGISSVLLSGGDGDDRLEARGVLQLTLTGGLGTDTFVLSAQQYQAQQKGTMQFATIVPTEANGWNYGWTDVTARPMEITDFTAGVGGDVLEIQDLLRNGATGFDGSNPFGSSAYLRLAQSGADTLLQFDVNGGGDSYVTLAVLKNVTATALVGANFNPAYPTDGSEMPGIVIDGNADADTLLGSAGGDTISGFEGNDSIDGDAGYDSILGGDGNDTIDGNFGNDTIYGGLGNDTLLDAQGSNYLDGEEGDDSLTAWSLTGNHTLVGGLGNDTIDGTGLSLNLQSGDGVDYICAHGNLVVSGTTSYVQHGAATISGGAGDDGYYTQWDGSGYYSNNLSAIYLTDVLIQGDEGRDGLSVEFAKNARLEGGVGADILSAYANGWHLGYFMGESSYDINYQLDGGADDDRLTVTSSAHRHYGRIDLSLEGGTGNDTLTASTESPADANYGISSVLLSGGDGDDRLEARGVLQLTLTGGLGTDTFVLSAQQYQAQQKGTMQFATIVPTEANGWNYGWTDVTARPMEITDFTAGVGGDVLEIQDLLRNGATGFDGSNPFGSSAYLRLAQSGADTLLQFDVNGGGDSYVTLAVLKNVTATALVGANFNPAYPTDGSEMPGIVIDGNADADTLLGSAGGDTISGFEGNDSIDGDAGYDSILGGDGNDTIDGNFGNDTIYGGLGNDTLLDAQGSNYLDGEEGDDSLTAWSLTGNHTLVGGLGNDTIDGTGLSLNLQSGDGVDYICAHGNLVVSGTTSYVQHGAATISGGAGDDGYYTQWDGSGYYSNNLSAIYLTDVLIQGDEGRDGLSVEFAKNARLEGGVGADILSAYANGWHLGYFMGESSYDINYQLDGGADDDRLTVTSSAHRHYGRIDLSLEGGTGNDTLTASTESPADANYGISSVLLSGGDGDDRLEARGVLQLTLTGGLGTDTFVLSAQQYQAQQKGTMQFATIVPTEANGWNYGWTDVTARPMEITDFTAGRSGETLDIRDLLQNGATNYDGTNPFKSGHLDIDQVGDDTLLKFDANGGGDNFVTIAVLKNVKDTDLVARNFSPLFGTPNGDTMSGLRGDKPHDGMGGNDKMVTNEVSPDDPNLDANWEQVLIDNPDFIDEANILDGGEGADSMAGGNGNDTYHVDNPGDVIKEAAGHGNADKVIATIDYIMSGEIENLNLGNGASKGTGNALGNEMRANDNGNELIGGGGNDKLHGGKGKDRLYAGDGDDQVNAGEGDDEIVGGDGAGNDTYTGGLGIDTVIYTSAVETIMVNLAAGTASGVDIGSDVLISIENIVGGQTGDVFIGDTQANDMDAYTGNDSLNGGAGNDTLTGDAGNDTLDGGTGVELDGRWRRQRHLFCAGYRGRGDRGECECSGRWHGPGEQRSGELHAGSQPRERPDPAHGGSQPAGQRVEQHPLCRGGQQHPQRRRGQRHGELPICDGGGDTELERDGRAGHRQFGE